MDTMQENKPILIVGLGNPGSKYEQTRHNIGFMVLDYFANENNADKWKSAFNAQITSFVSQNGRRVILAKPQTFMNNSGQSVLAIAKFYKLDLTDILVVHDELDINFGCVKTKIGGGSAGHNGIKSIDKLVGRDFIRVRVGVSHPRNLGYDIDAADWVLSRFSTKDMGDMKSVISHACDSIDNFINNKN